MFNEDFYRDMIGQYNLVSGMPEGEGRAEEILQGIFRHIKLDKDCSFSEGVVEGMEKYRKINAEHSAKVLARQVQRNGSK